jgi:hypothetical protein
MIVMILWEYSFDATLITECIIIVWALIIHEATFNKILIAKLFIRKTTNRNPVTIQFNSITNLYYIDKDIKEQ